MNGPGTSWFSEWSWDELPALPPEIVLLPRRFPLNLYDFACWARATFVPLAVVFSVRPARPLGFTIDELRASHASRTSAQRRSGLGAFFDRVDVALHGYERLVLAAAPLGALRRLALRRALDWVVRRQESDGSLAGIQLPSMFGLIALHLGGYALDHPVVATGLAGLDRYAVVEDAPGGRVRRIDAARSDVWDTAMAVTALLDAGETGDHPALRKACQFLLDQEIRTCADWSVQRPGLEPGCWGFGLYNDLAPDADDTAEVVMALHRAASRPRLAAGPTGRAGPAGFDTELRVTAQLWPAASAPADRGVAWATGMQSRSGGFPLAALGRAVAAFSRSDLPRQTA